MLARRRQALLWRLAAKLRLDGEQFGDPLQRRLGDRRLGGGMHLVELASGMRPAGDLDQRCRAAWRIGLAQPVEAGVAVGMQEAATAGEQRPGMLALAVR